MHHGPAQPSREERDANHPADLRLPTMTAALQLQE